MGTALDTPAVAEKLRGERERRLALPDAGRPVEEVGVRRSFADRRLEEPLRLRLLDDLVKHARRAPL